MKELTIGLILTATTGLTILAYKHPKSYAKILPWLIGAIFSAFLLCMIWDAGISKSYISLIPYIDSDKLQESSNIIDGKKVLSSGIFVYWIISIVYFNLIKLLYFVRDHDNENKK